jgi:uncharacterized protein YhaN
MAIRIDKITVRNCGPLKEFNEELHDLNLIYSENERGKSFLVEFIIHCLFKNKSFWQLRETGQGKIFLRGLGNKIIEFTPSKGQKKLEDFLERNQKGLPPSLSNLLIVKEGETKLVKNELGVDKNAFKEILSPRKVLDEIDSQILPTLKKAKLENEGLIIEKRGDGSNYYNLKDKIAHIEELIKQIINEYEQGEIKDLEFKKEKLRQIKDLLIKAKKHEAYQLNEKLKNLIERKEEIPESSLKELRALINEYFGHKTRLEDLNRDLKEINRKTQKLSELSSRKEILLKAKRHEAYKIKKEIENIERELNKISEKVLDEIKQNIAKYKDKYLEKEDKRRMLEELRIKSRDYSWLKTAKENYNRFLNSTVNIDKGFSIFPYLIVLSFIAGMILIFIDQKTGGMIFFILSATTAFYYFTKLKNSFKNYKEAEEIKSIKNEFFAKFGEELDNLTKLEDIVNEQERIFHEAQTYEREINRLNLELQSIIKQLEELFRQVGYSSLNHEQWNEKVMELQNQKDHLWNEYQSLKVRLNELNVEEAEYELNDPGVKFNKKELEKIEKEIAGLEQLKKQEEQKKENKKELEQQIYETKEKITKIFNFLSKETPDESEWKIKLEELEQRRKNIENEIKEIEGKLSGLGVPEHEFEKEDPKKTFSQSELESIERQIAETEEKLQKRNEELSRLRDKIIQHTGADFSADWNEMIEKVYLKKDEISESLSEIEAKIIAGLVVHETIEELQKQEDEKLLEKLNSEDIVSLIQRLTRRYKALSFDEKDIIISDDYFSFNIKDLSTGAKEQVMIALRIGFAKSILKQETAFLIFDDAFQHSDYKKRPLLIDTLFDLAQEGWQIIYLTMDNHIRDLFREKISNRAVNFKEISLN